MHHGDNGNEDVPIRVTPDIGLVAPYSRRWRQSVQRLSLALLVAQNSVLVMVMHHSLSGPTGAQPRYRASTAVLLVEAVKLAASLVLATYDSCASYRSNQSCRAVLGHLRKSIFSRDSWKLVVPAALYTLQNSLVYTAISNLDAVTFQVTCQLKIITTVLFSILLLGKRISSKQWLSLILLTFGIAMVQITGPLNALDRMQGIIALLRGDVGSNSGAVKGFLAAVASSLTSGLTCVYFEKLIKDSRGSVSLWTRNVQLSFFSLFPAFLVGVCWQDGVAIHRDGFFAGYTLAVWLTILLQAVGGLIVAVCITYADNVTKNFAASLSIVVSYGTTIVVDGIPATLHSTAGASIVLLAMYLYNSRSPAPPPLLPMARQRMHLAEKPAKTHLLQP
ncbi:hypothetical protein QBC42DRAFT_337160 [Cladorrhinum samala]|uniref:UDP-galactose transporter n=1 Tax=Cladorrhinum samala TaxID=585594 RepID=A0AAV9HWH6_9PEZI|nr:hypothetical protein QBC42DRAFT_337160 [Cladorrhinum samala]